MKIKSQLVGTFLAISLIPIIIVGTIQYVEFAKELQEDELNDLNTIAEIQKQRLTDEVNHSFEILNLIKSGTDLREHLVEYLDTENISSQQRMNEILSDTASSTAEIVSVSIFEKTIED